MKDSLALAQLFPETLDITVHIVSALVAGGVIGLERSSHGRAAGFRTHALVCMASSVLMVLSLFQGLWLKDSLGASLDYIQTDPTRMAQGIMTGIGFLGAGVIYKEGATLHGLTTAASIWMTAAIGVLLGCGFWVPGVLATLLTLLVLSLFRWIEERLPVEQYALCTVGFGAAEIPPESALRTLLAEQGYKVITASYWLDEASDRFEYRLVISERGRRELDQLTGLLRKLPQVRSLHVAPAGR